MTVFIKTWDESNPQGSRSISLGDNDIRDFKYAIRERLAEDHRFYTSESGQTNVGLHNKSSYVSQASAPATLADSIILFSQDVNAKSELHSKHEDSITSQLTYLGKLWISGLKVASEAAGDLIYFNGTIWNRFATGNGFLSNDGSGNLSWGGIGGSGIVSGKYSGLRVSRPSASTVTVTAGELSLKSTGGVAVTASTVSVTANITNSGANGLDAPSEASSTWYYIWVIRNSTTSTVAALLSTSSTAPTMPAGYDQKALVSAVRNDSGSDFVNFNQYGSEYYYARWLTIGTGDVGTGAWVSIDTTASVPSGLSEIIYVVSFDAAESEMTVVTNDNTVGVGDNSQVNVGGGRPDGTGWHFHPFDFLTANTIYWASNSNSCRLFCQGFKITKA